MFEDADGGARAEGDVVTGPNDTCPDCDGTGRVTYSSDEYSHQTGHYTVDREEPCPTCCPDDSPRWLRTDGPEAYV